MIKRLIAEKKLRDRHLIKSQKEEILFLRNELIWKQETMDNLLNQLCLQKESMMHNEENNYSRVEIPNSTSKISHNQDKDTKNNNDTVIILKEHITTEKSDDDCNENN